MDIVWVGMEHNSGGAGVVGVYDSLETAEADVKGNPAWTKTFSSPDCVRWSKVDKSLHLTLHRKAVKTAFVPDVVPDEEEAKFS